ncbi:uroporphyrinogen-III synthase [Planococcus maritimus]|uniref:uroporphyrinogen-III synthase n=1 Tax=Planococcus maritimus TaxID=192421 RepID=UPI00080F1A74|nr:uroporphyrinogen-III synthase [Planococcus maritimus]ANU16921.1 uroporphyrinogen-III synthase [Planococcus maritimus]
MYKKKPVIIFTGSRLPKEAAELAQQIGAQVEYFPLIETVLRDTSAPDFGRYGWLIFTSRNSAEAFCKLRPKTSAKIAAVGDKTAEMLEANGYSVDFIPTTFSADVFVREFPDIAGKERCLFVRGALAKDTILSMSLEIDEWTVYDTVKKHSNAQALAEMSDVTIIFASPSAVAAYTEAGGNFKGIRTAAIGHITERAIVEAGGDVDFRPETYTYLEIIQSIAKGSCSL